MFRALASSAVLLVTAPGIATAMDGGVRSVVGSCADGSVIFATTWEQVHCEGALRMPPGYVPRVASQRDRATALAEITREEDLEAQVTELLAAGRHSSRPPVALVALTAGEHAALLRLVALGRAPAAATIEHERGVDRPDRLRLAASRGFGRRLRRALAGSGESPTGPVLVFRLEPSVGPSAPVPSFAQGGVTFRPDPGDARQLGWIAEAGVRSRRDTSRLGYIVLPRGFDTDRPLAIFWGDAVVATRPWRES